MSNTSKGLAAKGSKYWMQAIVNSGRQKDLNAAIGEELDWISPTKGDNNDYLEYHINQECICRRLGISESDKEGVFAFWPNRQPQWDGIALSKDKKTLFLVEAKAHLTELNSKISASSEKSRKQIIDSMQIVFDKYYAGGCFEMWTNKYYQLGNRLTFLHMLNDNLPLINFQTKLVLLNFVNDGTYIKTTDEEWREHYNKVLRDMLGLERLSEDILVINFPV